MNVDFPTNVQLRVEFFDHKLRDSGHVVCMMRQWCSGSNDKSVAEVIARKEHKAQFPVEYQRYLDAKAPPAPVAPVAPVVVPEAPPAPVAPPPARRTRKPKEEQVNDASY